MMLPSGAQNKAKELRRGPDLTFKIFQVPEWPEQARLDIVHSHANKDDELKKNRERD